VLTVGAPPGKGEFDPVLMSGAPGDVLLVVQVLENLVRLDQRFVVRPALATEWTSEDGTAWRFTLREGVRFSNGKRFSAADVVASLERLRSWELGSPLAASLENVENVVVDDPLHVTFVLKEADAEFPAVLTDPRAKMLCRSVKDPMTRLVGTGPFVLSSYVPGRRAVLVRNTRYWGSDESGTPLPYLDELRFRYAKAGDVLVDGLLDGTLNWVGGLTAGQRQTVKESDAAVKVTATATNAFAELQIRCDQGPGKDRAVRRALLAGTNREALAAAAPPAVGIAGNGTVVGPAYSEYYREEAPAYNPDEARQLLAAAGYNDGLVVRLAVPATDPLPALARAWRAQMKQIGVAVKVVTVAPEVFFAGAGPDTWQKAQFCLVDWPSAATPITYFRQSFVSGGSWNYSRWEDAAFDALVAQMGAQVDPARRAQLYEEAQQVLQDKAPAIVLLLTKAFAGQSRAVDGVRPAPDWSTTVFCTAHIAE
jgi:peptide/nickel transport system substrate-binding protein